MAGDPVSELRETIGAKKEAIPVPEEVAAIRAMAPQDTLQPLAELFARAGDRKHFLGSLCEYARMLVGASAVVIHEKGDEGIAAVGLAVADEKADRRQWLLAGDVLEKIFTERRSVQAHTIVGGRQHARLSVPFFIHGGAPLCLTAFLPPERIAFADPCFAMLHLVTQFVVQRELLEEAHEKEAAFNQATMLVAMFSRTGRGTPSSVRYSPSPRNSRNSSAVSVSRSGPVRVARAMSMRSPE